MVLNRLTRNGMRNLHPSFFKTTTSNAASDHYLFTKKTEHSFTIILDYVDDVILAGTSLTKFTAIKTILHDQFKIKDLG